jgi:two-component system, NarL family, sensor histidine kinase DesK
VSAGASGAGGTTGPPPPTIRRSPWFVALDLPFVAAGLVTTVPRHHPTVGATVLLVLVSLAIGGLQTRHSLAAVRAERPAGAVWTFLALAALVYAPMWWYTWDWAVMQWFVVASAAMLLPTRVVALAAGPIVGQTVVAGWYAAAEPGAHPGLVAAVALHQFTVLAMGSAVVYGSVWLALVVADLDAARTEMAELAVGRERLRMSRDVHDLLGQSLSAVSLKGDLALRLMPTDPAAARAEIESLTDVARSALSDVRAVVHDRHVVSLPAELAAATALLGAARVEARVDVDLSDLSDPTGLPWPVEEVLAWAVREGTTNMLRHSDATACSITAERRDRGSGGAAGTVRLEIVNDGVPASGPEGARRGTGIAGLTERTRVLSGAVTAGRTPDGRFHLVVDVPAVPEAADA